MLATLPPFRECASPPGAPSSCRRHGSGKMRKCREARHRTDPYVVSSSGAAHVWRLTREGARAG
jgi:hypothetical protein